MIFLFFIKLYYIYNDFLTGFFIMSVHNLEISLISGKKVTLSTYKGKLLLIVNTASLCGFASPVQPVTTVTR